MKKTIILSILLCVIALKGYAQCKTCHDGAHFQDNNAARAGKALPPDSSGGLAKSFALQNVCGLNWEQSSVLVETRSQNAGFNTNGTGLPCTVPLTFDSCSVDSLVKAFLYFNGSYQTAYAANPASVSITNPVAKAFNYSADSIGTGTSKCWGEIGTIAYRVDITSCIKGGGNYTVNLSGTGITSWAVDGITMLIVYIDKSATYSGSLVLWDGLYTTTGGSKSQTFSGFDVCKATPTGQAFTIQADMQSNENGGINTEDLNSSIDTFPNLFYNFCTVTTSLKANQSTLLDSVYTNDGGDCYSWVLAGLYWQNTNCMTCKPLVKGTLAISVRPPADTICPGDSVQLTASGANTYIWGPATGLSCTNCPNPKASPNSTTTYSITGFDGCIFGTDTVRITVGSSAPPVITPVNPVTCSPGSVQLNATGGTNYVWRPAATLSCTRCPNPLASPTVTTTYTLVDGFGGCKDSTTVTVKVTKGISAVFSIKDSIVCPHDSSYLTVTTTGGPATYKWSNGATTSSIHVSDTATTTYTVTAYGICDSIKKTFKVTVMPSPKPVISGPSWRCAGKRDTLTVSSSTNPTTYVWDDGKTTTTYVTGPINADSIVTVTAYNSFGCPVKSIDTILLRQQPNVYANPPAIFCVGQPITLTASATGTFPPFTYKWSTGQTGTSITLNPGPDSATSYTVTASNGCVGTAVTIAIPNVPILNACCSQVLTNFADTTILVANGNSKTYQWEESPDKGTITCLNPPLCDSVRVIAPVTTSYTVIGTDSNGCQGEQILLIDLDIPCFDAKIPNVFTPNTPGPLGLNNVFYIQTINMTAWSITIYDRWGREIYNSSNPAQYWDGTTEAGGKASDGVYYYIITATCQNNTYKKDGFIQLIR